MKYIVKPLRKIVLVSMLVVPFVAVALNHSTYAASCTPPSTDYGTVTSTVSVSGSGTYRVWTRMSAPNTTNDTYMLQIDGNTCYNIGGNTIPNYASGATTFFKGDASNWTSKTTTGSQIDVSLTSGSHTFKLIGNADGVVVDRLVLTQDTTCQPTGTGDNCANPPDTTPPTVNITAPASGATISGTTTFSANANDDVAIKQVGFYVDGTFKVTDTSSPYNYSFDPTGYSNGTHTVYAHAIDTSNNATDSATVTFTVNIGGGVTYKPADINKDRKIDYLDLSILATNYNKTAAASSNPRADINGNGTVDYLDLSALASGYNTSY